MTHQPLTDEQLRSALVATGVNPAISDAELARSFEELGLDSLARLEIATRVQDLVGLDMEDQIGPDTSPRALQRGIAQRLAETAA
ncbi:phosphopantetheine-binding protein [Streptomyces sp. ICN988]|uniref:phosphopantetheine-binding protein n=1 Tax=unclassified Streptomyces TaxID=2593676 RepID=UPI0021E45286|nr:phosphopantetheine-binding protein [Streptomyces sp. ICN988]MCV2461740.1 phosphopantetheine-binding protein [Streptomyces sp. ICN988]